MRQDEEWDESAAPAPPPCRTCTYHWANQCRRRAAQLLASVEVVQAPDEAPAVTREVVRAVWPPIEDPDQPGCYEHNEYRP